MAFEPLRLLEVVVLLRLAWNIAMAGLALDSYPLLHPGAP